jgi:cell wall-associated NlpC family hydrolase
VNPSTLQLGNRVVAAARACVGVPYRHLGRTPERGLDCVGLVLRAFQEAGLLLEVAPASYGRRPEGHRLVAELARHGRRLATVEARPADVLAFAGSERLPCHLALVTETVPGLQIIHAWAEFRRVAEHALDGFSGGAPIGAYRHPALEWRNA